MKLVALIFKIPFGAAETRGREAVYSGIAVAYFKEALCKCQIARIFKCHF